MTLENEELSIFTLATEGENMNNSAHWPSPLCLCQALPVDQQEAGQHTLPCWVTDWCGVSHSQGGRV